MGDEYPSEEMNRNAEMLFNGQVELIQLAVDFAGSEALDIYVYASAENTSCAYYALFGIGGEMLTPDEIEGKSDEDVYAFMKQGCKLLVLVIRRCKTIGVPVPTEFKIHHWADNGEISSTLKYDPVHPPLRHPNLGGHLLGVGKGCDCHVRVHKPTVNLTI